MSAPDTSLKVIIGNFVDNYLQILGAESKDNSIRDQLKQCYFKLSFQYYVGHVLNKTYPVKIKYMDDEAKKKLRYDLFIAYILLAEQYKKNKAMGRRENKSELLNQQVTCLNLIKSIQFENEKEHKESIKKRINELKKEGIDGKPCKYLCFFMGKFLGAKISELTNAPGKTKVIIKWMEDINERRLYWIWCDSLLDRIMADLPSDFYNVRQARAEINAPNPIAGELGWILYYFRFGINLSLFLKHTVKNPWMAESEKEKTWTERFASQWKERKFGLINDPVWATANLVCFFWWVGPGVKGMKGDLLTCGLLVVDLMLAVWQHVEAKADFHKEIAVLEKKLSASDSMTDDQIQNLKKIIKVRKRDWYYQQMSQINDIAYAVGLLISFTMMTTPFMQLSAPVLLMSNVTGTVACFALTVISSGISGLVDVAQSKCAAYDASCEIELLKMKFNESTNVKQKQLIFLEYKEVMAEKAYQEQLSSYQAYSAVRMWITDALTPAIMFAATTFFSMGTSFAILSGALVLNQFSKMLIDKYTKPEETKTKTDNEVDVKSDEYVSFKESAMHRSTFFRPETPKDSKTIPSLPKQSLV